MKTKAKLFLAKLLISFSIVLIGIGVVLTFVDDEAILHPVHDVTVVAVGDNDGISVTTVDDDEKNESIIENNVSDTNGQKPVENKPVVEEKPEIKEEKPNTTTNNNSNNNSNSNNNETVNTQTPPQAVVTPTIEEKNATLRNNIQNTYGVVVKYGNETSSYSVGGMSTIAISDANIINTALVNLNKALELYPSGFFQEVKGKGYPLTFYLIKRYSKDNVTGVTDSSSKNIVISIATDYDFADTFHHEVYHYMERYILSTGFTFTSWNTLNPSGFNYGTFNGSYSYAKTFSEDAFFVNTYAMTDQYEDRASTFEYMMKSSKASCFNYGKTIWLKAKTMCEQIDYFFSTVTESNKEHWERHVY